MSIRNQNAKSNVEHVIVTSTRPSKFSCGAVTFASVDNCQWGSSEARHHRLCTHHNRSLRAIHVATAATTADARDQAGSTFPEDGQVISDRERVAGGRRDPDCRAAS